MIVIDTSIAIKWFRREEKDRDKALLIYNQHLQKKGSVTAPFLIFIEIANVLATSIGPVDEDIQGILDFIFQADIAIDDVTYKDLLETSLLAKKYKTTVYDMLFAVVAKRKKCDLVTADQSFKKKTKFPFVKLLTEY